MIRNSKPIWFLAALIMCMCLQSRAQTGWMSMGTTETNQPAMSGIGGWSALAIDPAGIPYMAMEDEGDSNKATVRKFVNGIWTTVGARGFSAGDAVYLQMKINASGTIYVAYTDFANSYRPAVMKFDGTTWVPVGASSLYQGRGFSPSFAIDAAGDLFLEFTDSSGYVRAMEYTGSSWNFLGGPIGTGAAQMYSTISLDGSGIPYIAYADFNISAAPQIVKYNGSSWSPVGNLPSVGGTNNGICLAFNAAGTPFIAYDEPSNATGIVFQSFNGSSWTTLPSPSPTSRIQSNNAMAVDASGNVYIFTTGDNDVQGTIMKYDGTSWTAVGATDIGRYVQVGQIALSGSGTPFVSWSVNNTNAVVEEYTGGVWNALGTQGITNGYAVSPAIVSDSIGTAYMTYITGAYMYTAMNYVEVMTYDGSTWSAFGNGTVSNGSGYQPQIAIGPDGVQYVSYVDSANNLYVKKYNSGNWTTLGAPILTGSRGYTLKVSRSGTPYVAYLDTNYFTGRIRSYNGSTWNMANTNGFAPANAILSMDVDRHDTMYVAFSDSVDRTMKVLKYNGSAWVSMNPPVIKAVSMQILLDTAGVIYLLCTDTASHTAMLRYDGNSWTTIGSPGFIPFTYYQTFVLDRFGRPYLTYTDIANDYKETVITYNGGNWSTVGLPDFTIQRAEPSAIAVSPLGTVYTVFSNGGSIWGYQYSSLPDSTVWPGDADANHIVDNTDLLPIGLAYAATGPVRAVQGIVWQADVSTDWGSSFATYSPLVNYKHADCDGNGTINADDTLAIVTNFGLLHAKTNGYAGPWRNSVPVLGLSFAVDTVLDTQTLATDIYLGDSSLSANNIYGLAFTLNFDPIVTDSATAAFSFVPSWLGSTTNSINISKTFYTAGQVKAAITGINHQPRTGSGRIAHFTAVITTGNINGKDLSYYTNYSYISDITAIDQLGNRLQLNAGIDSNKVGYYPNGIHDIDQTATVSIYPNPAAHSVRISSGTQLMSAITITDMLGQNVMSVRVNNKTSETVDLSDLESGVYMIRVSTSYGSATTRLVVSR